MENNKLTNEIKKLTELLRQSTSDKKDEIEKKLVELYFELYRNDTELAQKVADAYGLNTRESRTGLIIEIPDD